MMTKTEISQDRGRVRRRLSFSMLEVTRKMRRNISIDHRGIFFLLCWFLMVHECNYTLSFEILIIFFRKYSSLHSGRIKSNYNYVYVNKNVFVMVSPNRQGHIVASTEGTGI